MSKSKTLFFTLLGILLISGMLTAQTSKAKFIGTVLDNEGAALPGVAIEATSPKLVGRATAITNVDGNYRLLGLPPGTYAIRFSLPGFTTVVRKGIKIGIDETLTLDIALEVSTIEEEITVVGEAPLVDVKSTIKGMTLTKEMFEMLPRGRNFDTLVTAIPGVNDEPYAAGISVDGASGAENMYYMDGMDITNLYGGDRGQSAAFEFVDEVSIKASGYPAEYGGSMGGVVNVITRSGGNEYHGELIGYYSGSKLNSKERDTLRLDLFDVTKAEYINYQDEYGKDKDNRYEVGFNIGGYVFKDKLWFFTTFLPVFRDTTRHIEWADGGQADIKRKRTYWNGAVKLTAQPMRDLRLSANFVSNFYKYRGELPDRAGTQNPLAPWEDYGYDYPNWTANLSADYTIGNNFMINARGGYFYRDENNEQVHPDSPRWRFMKEAPGYAYTTNSMFPEIPAALVHPRGWYNCPTPYARVKDIRNRASANIDLSYYLNLAGEHAWKAGVQAVRIGEDIDNATMYEYIFLGWDRSWIDIATGEEKRGKYGYYAVRGSKEDTARGDNSEAHPYGAFASPHSWRWAIYLQDSWTPDFLESRLTLNFGVRAEKEDIPTFSDLPEYQYPPVQYKFTDKIAPRLGFIYDVFGDASTKVFGSFGYYYDVMKLDMAIGSYGGMKWISDYYTLDDYDFTKIGNGNYPGTYLYTYNWRKPSFDTTDDDLKPMKQSEISFGAERKLIENLSASVRFVYKHLIYTIEDVGVMTPGGEAYYTTNPGYGWSLPESQGGKFSDKYPACPRAKREYYAVNFNLDKRFSDNWLGGFSYTWSRLSGNYGGLASSDEWGRNDPNVERYFDLWYINWDKDMNEIVGLLNTDRTHQFKFYGSYAFPFGLTAGLVVNGMSGIPVTRELHVGLEGYYPDGRASDGRAPFLLFANAYAEYNLKVTDRYKIQLSLNVDNMLDTKAARRLFTLMNQTSVIMNDDERLAGWSYDENAHTATTKDGRIIDYVPDPRFLMERSFYPPLEARIGLKIIF